MAANNRIFLVFLVFLAIPACERGPRDTTEPSEPASPRATRSEVTQEGSFRVSYRPSPAPVPLNEYFELSLTVTPYEDGEPLPEDLEVGVDAAMPDHGHGMNVRPEVRALDHGSFEAEGMLFHMPGYWELYVEIMADGVTETAVFPVELEP